MSTACGMQGGSGSASNRKFMNVEMNNVKNPIIIDQNYCDQKEPCTEKSSAVQVRDVLYRNITGTSASKVAIKFDCSKSFQCKRIVLQNVHIQRHGDENHQPPEASCENVEWTDAGIVTPLCPNIAIKTKTSDHHRHHLYHHHHHE